MPRAAVFSDPKEDKTLRRSLPSRFRSNRFRHNPRTLPPEARVLLRILRFGEVAHVRSPRPSRDSGATIRTSIRRGPRGPGQAHASVVEATQPLHAIVACSLGRYSRGVPEKVVVTARSGLGTAGMIIGDDGLKTFSPPPFRAGR